MNDFAAQDVHDATPEEMGQVEQGSAKVKIEEHGEIGPMPVAADHDFKPPRRRR